ncbi:MAG TPA: beta-glucosidase BglX [Steroidobacteraceae bacterium]|nr:beta-glucosidase BglX [Steroidobacteraceae bacterium]
MTLDEKIGQLVQRAGGRSKSLNSKLDDAELENVRAGRVGSYLHVAGAEPLARLQQVAVKESRLGIPLLFAMDVVHGYRTIFPVPLAVSSTWSPESAELMARVSADEATAAGLHWTFAPMVDVARDARWGRIVEGAGEDPYLGSQMAVAQVHGYQLDDLRRPDTLLASTKHFGAYSAVIGGRDYNTADISERTLQEVYLPPFYAAAHAGSGTFMTAFNDIAGVPTTANRELVRGLLREQWGYQGLIVSDWQAIAELLAHGVAADRSQAASLALDASVDMDMVGAVYEQDLKAVIEAHPERMQQLDEAVLRILRTKEALGLFDKPMQYHDLKREQRTLLSARNRAAARDIARQSIVLLRNDGNLLPLNPAKLKTLAVIGGLAADSRSELGSWRAQGRDDDVVNILKGIEDAAPKSLKVVYSPGSHPASDDRFGIDAAAQLAKNADAVVLVIGEGFDLSGEARSRADIGLPASQVELAVRILATGTPTVIVLSNGRPLALPPFVANAPALLETWMLGVEAGPAVADVLFGHYSPGGRLTATFPHASGELPLYYAKNPTGRPADPDLAKDTSRYMDQPITPAFPFGHGLSYTAFEYSDLTLDRARIEANGQVAISVTVKNIGRMVGDEVVQLYVHDVLASIERPVQQLRGFKRVTLKPGESARVTFQLSAAQLALYDKDGRWAVEPGRIDVMVGASSADIRAHSSFEITTAAITRVPAAAIATPVTVERKKS